MASQNKKTHFGFKEIEEKDKAQMVRGVFSSVASKYDIMNDVMSFGIHRIWKNSMMDWLSPQPNQKLLDVAGGTGDISFRFLKRAPSAHATVFDMTQSMLDEGQVKSLRLKKWKTTWIGFVVMLCPFHLKTIHSMFIQYHLASEM